MIKTLKVRLYPNKDQEALLNQHFGACRFLWNRFLEVRMQYHAEHKDDSRKGLTAFDTMKMLTALKKDKIWLNNINSQSLQHSLVELDKAFRSFFRHNSSYPSFKSKKGKQYFIVPSGFRTTGNRFIIPKFMEGILFRDKAKIPTTIKQAVVTRDVERYYASIQYESSETPKKGNEQVGIDVGLKTFATLSNGIVIENPHSMNKFERRIKRQQKKLARKKKGSANRKKDIVRLQTLYQHLTDTRQDFLHKASTAIAKLSDVIVMEDLNIQGMMRNHHLAKGIGDVSWYRFKRMLEYKAEWRGIEFIEIGMFEASSSVCSRCGWYKRDLKLSDRVFHCNACGLVIDRDLNAAINIRNMGLIKVGKGIPEFTPVEIATSAELFNRGGLRDAGQ